MAEVVVPIGPQHPALKEPVNFKVVADGEVLVRLELDISYTPRGIEKAAEARDFVRVVPLLERVCGICSHSHTTVFVKGIEEAMKVDVPPRAQAIRTIVAELERMHSHLLWLGVAAHEIGFNTLFMWTWRDREAVQDMLEEITGNRVNYGINEVGGVRRDLKPAVINAALARLPLLEQRIATYADMAARERTMLMRFQGVGKLTKQQALDLGAVGPTARASGVDYDVRKDDPYLSYPDVPWKVVTDDHGDAFGRTPVRVGELREGLGIVRHCLENLPGGPITTKAPRAAPRAEVLSRYEAPRGEPRRAEPRGHSRDRRGDRPVPFVHVPHHGRRPGGPPDAHDGLGGAPGPRPPVLPGEGGRLMDPALLLLYMLVFPGFLFLLGYAFFLQFVDRKVSARMSARGAPPLLQPFPDFVKRLR